MRKLICVSLSFILLASLAIGQSAFAAEFKWPKTLNIQSKASMGPYYQTIAAWGPLLEGDTGTKVRVIPSTTPAVGLKNLVADRILINGDDGDAIVLAQEGAAEFAQRGLGPLNIRAIWGFEPVYRGILVRGDSKLQTLDDIGPGTSFGHPPGPHAIMDVYATAAWLGIDKDELKYVQTGGGPSSARAIVEGKADCSHVMITDPLVYELAANPEGVRWLTFDAEKNPEAAERWRDVKPLTFFQVPPKRMNMIESAQGKPFWGNTNFFTAKAETDEELIYNLVKWLNENLSRFADKHSAAYAYDVNEFRKSLDVTFVPIHAGTIKYLKELNMWTAEDEKRQAYNVGVYDQYVAAYKAAIAEADSKKIKVTPANEEWMDLWAQHKSKLPVIRLMTEIP
jgi:TRAP transporter TAXI family solute receptor